MLEKPLLNVNDLRQYYYCKRIVYYNWVIPVKPPITYSMERGLNLEQEFERLEPRRSLSKYNLSSAERLFQKRLTDYNLGLTGIADLILKTDDCLSVVEFKATSTGITPNRLVQIVAYSMLANSQYNLPCTTCFFIMTDGPSIDSIQIEDHHLVMVKNTINSIHQLINDAYLPEPTTSRNRCINCEFRNFCGDIF